jgi:hypothetical protein
VSPRRKKVKVKNIGERYRFRALLVTFTSIFVLVDVPVLHAFARSAAVLIVMNGSHGRLAFILLSHDGRDLVSTLTTPRGLDFLG